MKRTLLLAILMVRICFLAIAQSYSFVTLSPDQGFPSKVNSIVVQPHGYAVLGSDDGLYCYLGNGSVVSYESLGELGQSGNYVTDLYYDDMDYVWCLTDHGFFAWKVPYDGSDPDVIIGPKDVNVYSVFSYGKEVFFGGESCLWKYDHKSKSFAKVVTLDRDEAFDVSSILFAFYHDQEVLVLFNKFGRVFHLFYLATGEVRTFFKSDLWSDEYFAAFTDSQSRLWLSDFGHGVNCIDLDGSLLYHYDTSNSGLSSNIVLCFAEREGRIWMGTDGGGISILNPDTGTFQILNHKENDPYSLPSSTITSIFCDHNGYLWCGRPHGGAIIINQPLIESFNTSDVRPFTGNGGISALFQDGPDDRIWVGTNGSGLMSFNPQDGSFTPYPSTAGMHIYSIASVDADRLVLSCPNKGFYTFNRHNGTIATSKLITDVKNYYLTNGEGACVDNDAEGRLLILSNNIRRYDARTGLLEEFSISPDGIKGNLRTVSGSQCRYLWDNDRLYEWDETAESRLKVLYDFGEDVTLRGCVIGPDGLLWLASAHSLGRFNLETCTVDFGNLHFDSVIQSVLCDSDGHFWLGTRNNLYGFFSENHTMVPLSDIDGVYDNEYIPNAKLVAANGDVYLGGTNSLVRIRSGFAQTVSSEPVVHLYKMYVDEKMIPDVRHLTISHKHNHIDLLLSTRSDNILDTKRFEVLIEGGGNTISERLETTPSIHLPTLTSGHYTVKASCTGTSGQWTPMTTILEFNVDKPWYRTILFFVNLSLFLIAILCYVILSRRKIAMERKNKEKARIANDMKSMFVQNMSHDIRTPLNAIVGYSQLLGLDDSLTEDERTEFVGYIEGSADMLSMLVDDVLSMSDIEQGNYAIAMTASSINDICEKSKNCSVMRVLAGVKMYCTSEVDDSFRIYTDPRRVQQILVNFLTNSCKHTTQGEIHVHCSISENPGMVTISVTDTGDGVPKDLADHIFERFKSGTVGGHGMGLNICRILSEKLGGSVRLDTSYTSGARFLLLLPLQSE